MIAGATRGSATLWRPPAWVAVAVSACYNRLIGWAAGNLHLELRAPECIARRGRDWHDRPK